MATLIETNVTWSDVCSTNNNSAHYTLRRAGRESHASKMWPCADQAFCRPFLPWGCIWRAMTSHLDDAVFDRSHVTFVTSHASQIGISAMSSYRQTISQAAHTYCNTCWAEVQQESRVWVSSDHLSLAQHTPYLSDWKYVVGSLCNVTAKNSLNL